MEKGSLDETTLVRLRAWLEKATSFLSKGSTARERDNTLAFGGGRGMDAIGLCVRQEFSNGLLGYLMACKIADVPCLCCSSCVCA